MQLRSNLPMQNITIDRMTSDIISCCSERDDPLGLISPSSMPVHPLGDDGLTMIFDVETTGLIPRYKSGNNPYILQLYFLVYDVRSKEVIQRFNSYVDVADSVIISDRITEITGITREICKKYGNSIEYTLSEFYRAYKRCSTFVAHNIEFDKKMLIIEMARNDLKLKGAEIDIQDSYQIFNDTYIDSKRLYCTMLNGVDICDIWVEYNKKRQKKWPTLAQLHEKLFGEIPNGLHDASVDTEACFKCYLKLTSENV